MQQNPEWTTTLASLLVGFRPSDRNADSAPRLRRRNAFSGDTFSRSNEHPQSSSEHCSGGEGSIQSFGSRTPSTQAVVGIQERSTTLPLGRQLLENQLPYIEGSHSASGSSVGSLGADVTPDPFVDPPLINPPRSRVPLSGARSNNKLPTQPTQPLEPRPMGSNIGSSTSCNQRKQTLPALPNKSSAPSRNFQSQSHQIGDTVNRGNFTQGMSDSRGLSPSMLSTSSQNQGTGGVPFSQNKAPGGSSQISAPQGPRNKSARPQGSTNIPKRGPHPNLAPSSGSQPLPSGRVNPQSMTLEQLSARFRGRVGDIRSAIEQSTGVPIATRNQIRQQVEQINRDFNDIEHRSQQEHQKLSQEKNRLQDQIDEISKRLHDVVQDRQRISAERDELLLKDELSLKKARSSERIKAIEEEFRTRETELLEKIDLQEQQLAGKRALWKSSNPSSSARRKEMDRNHDDPFNSPLSGHTTNFMSNSMTTIGSAPLQTPSNPSFGSTNKTHFGQKRPPPQIHYPPSAYSQRVSSRRMNLPSGKALPGIEFMNPKISLYDTNYNATKTRIITEPDLDHPQYSTALVLHSKEEELAEEYKVLFNKLFDRVEVWVRKYTNQPNAENDRVIASSNQQLWDYMMKLTYPNDKASSHAHVVALLNDMNCRFWFVMRMAVEYCTKEITTHNAFLGFSAGVDGALKKVEDELKVRGLANERRQVLIDQKARAIQSLVSSVDYGNFRGLKLNQHTKHLRDMLGPLLNVSSSRAVAGRELGQLVVLAWDLAVKMATSHVTFQVYFPDTGNKFNAATMVAKDNDTDALRLQIHQARLKLVITPVVTLRDDRGTTIIAKSVLNSNVLVMG